MITDEQLAQAQVMHQGGASMESVMNQMREQGVSLIGTMRLVMKLTGVSLAEARETVLNSVAWEDQKEAFWDFQNMLWDVWNKADEEDQEESAKSI